MEKEEKEKKREAILKGRSCCHQWGRMHIVRECGKGAETKSKP